MKGTWSVICRKRNILGLSLALGKGHEGRREIKGVSHSWDQNT